jgi:hypothetical protein
VRPFLTRALVTVGVLTALAVLDLGPRASAAYLSMASKPSAGLGAEAAADVPDSPPEPKAEPVRHERFGLVTGHVPGGGATSSNSVSSGPTSPAADLPPREPPAGGLTVYFRQSEVLLDLSAFVDSILDPPRRG